MVAPIQVTSAFACFFFINPNFVLSFFKILLNIYRFLICHNLAISPCSWQAVMFDVCQQMAVKLLKFTYAHRKLAASRRKTVRWREISSEVVKMGKKGTKRITRQPATEFVATTTQQSVSLQESQHSNSDYGNVHSATGNSVPRLVLLSPSFHLKLLLCIPSAGCENRLSE